jgi:hypothetical protein
MGTFRTEVKRGKETSSPGMPGGVPWACRYAKLQQKPNFSD